MVGFENPGSPDNGWAPLPPILSAILASASTITKARRVVTPLQTPPEPSLALRAGVGVNEHARASCFRNRFLRGRALARPLTQIRVRPSEKCKSAHRQARPVQSPKRR